MFCPRSTWHLPLYAWIDSTRTSQHGYAALGLMLVTLPVSAVGLILTSALSTTGFVLLPSGLGLLYCARGLLLAISSPDHGSPLGICSSLSRR
ncbi:hypothetical protein MAE02_45750 [Microvirga aerophila]|uniref:Uncharacterized protein n=1 Tax=Microvirga aerophila TaxID=670291 RepID=A0A512BY50_9HYPH|nr:hypothetical protein MAE02_45750 [Microvirga aerophila]